MYHLLKSIFKDWCEETNGIENARAGFGWFQTAKRDLRIILKWWNQEIMFVCLLAFLNCCTAAKVKLKVVRTEQTDPQEERNANRYLFPPGDFARKRRKSCCDFVNTGFCLDFNLLWLLSSCPFAHTELPLSNCHGSLLLQTIFARTGWIRLFLRSRSLPPSSHWRWERQRLLLTFMKSKVRWRQLQTF